MGASLPPAGSERLGPDRGSAVRLTHLGLMGVWGLGGLPGKVPGFRFSLGIFVPCSPGAVLSGGDAGDGGDKRWGSEPRASLQVTFLRTLFPPPIFETRREAKSNL